MFSRKSLLVACLVVIGPGAAQAACPALPANAQASGFLQMKAETSTSKSGVTTAGARKSLSVAEGSVVYSAALKMLIFCNGTGWLSLEGEPT